ncbi:MAG: hypothetical protein ICV54_27390 [Nostoc sp. C3-bin3]|nr:hypothetical protein [Nostoc sp. C3-bin3]
MRISRYLKTGTTWNFLNKVYARELLLALFVSARVLAFLEVAIALSLNGSIPLNSASLNCSDIPYRREAGDSTRGAWV